MREDKKKMKIKLTEENMKLISEYAKKKNINEKQAVDEIMQGYIDSNIAILINGEMRFYKTMAKIELDDMYKIIGCETVDVVRLENNIDIWVDDEGLLKKNVITEIEINGREYQLAGRLLFMSSNKEGETVPLTNKQVEYLMDNMVIKNMYGFGGI